MPPVLNHEVHESVRIDSTARYGCYNRKPYGNGYFAPERIHRPDGSFYLVQTFIKYQMSRECRFDMSLKDPMCEGCKHRGSGEAYDAAIRGHGS